MRITDHAPLPDLDHETLMAGIAAARRNGFGIHGVAYNANIVSIPQTVSLLGTNQSWSMEGILASVAGLTGSYYGELYGERYGSNPAASAHVANLGLLVSIPFTQSTIKGMRQGKIIKNVSIPVS